MSNKSVAKLDSSLLATKGGASAEGFRPPDWVVSTAGAAAWPSMPVKSAESGLPGITLVLPPEEHQRLVLMAAKLGMSAKKLVGIAVDAYLVYLDSAESVLQEALHGQQVSDVPAAPLEAPPAAAEEPAAKPKPQVVAAEKPVKAKPPAAKKFASKGGKGKKK